MKKKPKLKVYGDGGTPDYPMPVKGSPEHNKYLEWLNTQGTPLNPDDTDNYAHYIQSLNDPGYLQTPKVTVPTLPYKGAPKIVANKIEVPNLIKPVEVTPINTTPLGLQPQKKQSLLPLAVGSTLLGAGVNKIENEQRLNQENQYRTQFFQPNLFNSKRGNSDTALTAKGAKLGSGISVEYEGGENVRLPNGAEYEAIGPKHEQGGIKDELPKDTKILSDRLKPRKLLDIKNLSKALDVNVKSTDTYADVDKKLSKKYNFSKNQEIIDNGKYDELSKKTAKLMMNKANKEKDILFDIQQLHNGDSNGLDYEPIKKMAFGGILKYGNGGGPINPYKGDPTSLWNASRYNSEEWNDFAKQIKFDPATIPGNDSTEKKFQNYLYTYNNGQYKSVIDNLHQTVNNGKGPINGMFDGNLGTRWDSVLDAYKKGNSPVTPKAETLTVTNTPPVVEPDKPYVPNKYVAPIKPKYEGNQFDYSQVVPEGLALITDPGIKTWTRKAYANEVRPNTLNVQANLNDNTTDSYYAIKNHPKSASQIVANKYAENNKVYEAKNNYDTQSLNQANNINNQEYTRIDNVNYDRAKKQFDERDIATENQYARKNEIFNSLSGKLATYKNDEATKKLWFDLLSKNYDFKDGDITFNNKTFTPFVGNKAKEVKKTTTK